MRSPKVKFIVFLGKWLRLKYSSWCHSEIKFSMIELISKPLNPKYQFFCFFYIQKLKFMSYLQNVCY